MTIREATLADVPAMVEMGRRFIESSVYHQHIAVNPEHGAATFRAFINGESTACFVADVDGAVVGMFVMIAIPHLFSGELMATEIVWWMDPEYRHGSGGVRLLKVAEAWARARGAVAIQIGAPSTESDRSYAALGYGKVETCWQRRLESKRAAA